MVYFVIVKIDCLDPNAREAIPYPKMKKIISRERFAHATDAGSQYQGGGQTTWVL